MTTPVKQYSDRSAEATERTRRAARIRSKAKHYLFQQCREQAPEMYEKIIHHFEKTETDESLNTYLKFGVLIEPVENYTIEKKAAQLVAFDKVLS